LAPAIEAEIMGIDSSKSLNQEDYDKVYDSLTEHQVIFLREQNLTPQEHINFAKSFGDLEPPHPVYPHAEGYPHIRLLENCLENPPDSDVWHTDLNL